MACTSVALVTRTLAIESSEQLACRRNRDRADACDLANLARARVAPTQRLQVHSQVHEGLRGRGPPSPGRVTRATRASAR